MMLTERLAEIRARLEQGRETVAVVDESGHQFICNNASAECLAHAPADLRFLLRVVEEIESNRSVVSYMERNPFHVFGPDYQKGCREALAGVLRDIDRIAKEAGDE